MDSWDVEYRYGEEGVNLQGTEGGLHFSVTMPPAQAKKIAHELREAAEESRP